MCAVGSNDLELSLYYCNNLVWNKHVDNPSGCRIYYGDGNMINQLESFPVNLIEAVSFHQFNNNNNNNNRICIAQVCRMTSEALQGDHLSGKPGNVREFETCQGNVRDVVNSQGNVREKILSCNSVPKLFITR